jgi:hypothetical protein
MCGRQVQLPPLLLRLLPLLVTPGPLERRVERHGILGGDDVSERPGDCLMRRLLLRPCGLRLGELRRSLGGVVLPRLALVVARWRRGGCPLADDEGATVAPQRRGGRLLPL